MESAPAHHDGDDRRDRSSHRRAAPGPLLSVPPGSFDHYARLVQRMLGAPVALVSLVDEAEQRMPGAAGLTGELDASRRAPVSLSLCRHVVADEQPVVVVDGRREPRFAAEPAITELGVVAYAGHPLETADGRVVGSLCAVDRQPREWGDADLATLRDLAQACSTELQHRYEQRASSEELIGTLLDSIDVMIVFYDTRGRLVLANAQARAAAEAAGLSLSDPPYAGPHVRRADNRTPVPPDEQLLPRALRGEEQDFEMTWFGEHGRERAVGASAHQLRRPDGRPWGTLVSARDVTELARALQVKESFVSTVSHELRTPLAAVIGYAELLADELDEIAGIADVGSAEHALTVIRRRADDLQTRIGDLLDMADLRRRLVLASVDVVDLARSVVATMSEQAHAAGHRLELRATGVQPAFVDAQRVTQVVENLVSNALKHARGDDGTTPVTVTVAVDGDEQEVRVVVADDGVGMSEADRAQAFDRFWRAPEAHEGARPGIGIGLSLVHDIVGAHHGATALESRLGEGTRVVVRLPRSPAAVS